MKYVLIVSIILILFSFASITFAADIINNNTLKTEINTVRIDVLEHALDDLEHKTEALTELKTAIVSNAQSISNLSQTITRIQNMLEKIFMVLLGGILSALIGGGGIGFVFGSRKNYKTK